MHADKRGIGLDDALPLIIFIFIAASAIAVFKIYEKANTSKLISDIQQQKDTLEGHEALMGYLTKLDVLGITNADYMSKSYIENNYENLEQDLKEHLNSRLSVHWWRIELADKYGGNLMSIQNRDYNNADYYKIIEASAIHIPIYGEHSQYLSIRLFVGRHD